MPDFSMCSDECPFSKKCRRHMDSGTRPGYWQAWSKFEKVGDYKPTKPEKCEGWWPVDDSMESSDK